jgi:hypothetical protein
MSRLVLQWTITRFVDFEKKRFEVSRPLSKSSVVILEHITQHVCIRLKGETKRIDFITLFTVKLP